MPATPSSPAFKVVLALAAASFLAMLVAGGLLLRGGVMGGGAALQSELAEDIERANQRRAALREMRLAPFSLTDQSGRTMTESDLDGRYTLLSFMFSYCTLACPIMSGNMYRVYTEGPPHLRLISLSVDPINDTPERLAEYARNLRVSAPKWRMLSGPEDTVRAVARSLGFDFEEDRSITIDMGEGREMANIIHPTRFILFGPDRRIIDSFNGTDRADVDRLLLELRALPSQ